MLSVLPREIRGPDIVLRYYEQITDSRVNSVYSLSIRSFNHLFEI